jgi:hypothetical protein
MRFCITRFFQISLTAVLFFTSVVAPGCDQPVKLRVHTDPPGATLYWNTQPLGTSPCVVLLPPDSSDFSEVHVFEARKSGYEPAFHYLTARPKPSLTGQAGITIHLTKLPEGLSDADVPDALPKMSHRRRKKKNPYEGGLACEAKLLRVSDGRVLCQVSGVTRQEQIDVLAEQLAEQIKTQALPGEGGTLAVATTRNRRESELGRDLAEKMTQSLQRELSFASPFGVAKELDLNTMVREDFKDVSIILRDPEVAAELRGVRYVVLSGLAETVEP